MNEKRKLSEHMVKVLDLYSLAEEVRSMKKENGHDVTNTHYKPKSGLGVVEKNGKHYIVCDEGVGSEIALEDEPFEIYWYGETKGEKGNPGSIEIFPTAKTAIDWEELSQRTTIVKEIPLHEFIRNFGSRLEYNFLQWDNFLSK